MGHTDTNFRQGEEITVLPIEGFDDIPREFKVL